MADNGRNISVVRRVTELLFVAAVTVATMIAGQQLGVQTGNKVSPVWPASGANIALMLLFGMRIAPAIFIGSLLANYVTFRVWTLALLAPIGDTIEPLLAVALLRAGGADLISLFRSVAMVFRFIGAVSVAAAVATLVNLTLLSPVDRTITFDFATMFTYYVPCVIGSLVIVPAALTWINHGSSHLSMRAMAHGVLSLVCLVASCALLFFSDALSGAFEAAPLVFVTLPFIVWASLSLGAPGGALAVLLTSLITVTGTSLHRGPFNMPDLSSSLLILQLYLAIIAIMSLMMNAVLHERQRLYRLLESRHENETFLRRELDHRVRNNLSSLLTLLDRAAEQTSDDPVEVLATLRGRIASMSYIHSTVAASERNVISFRELVEQIVPEDCLKRVQLTGGDATIDPDRATALMLILHELTTNSIEHGALSEAGGSVAITCETTADNGNIIEWHWRESDGPGINGSPSPGFGIEMITGLTKSDLRGSATLRFEGDGVHHTFVMEIASTPATGHDAPRSTAAGRPVPRWGILR